jgi:lipopolysaccharide export system protein LptA
VKGLVLLVLLAGPAFGAASPVAGSVVNSDDWVMRRGAQREEEFSGHVRYSAAGTRMNSDWALFKHEKKTWDARGSVLVRRTLDDGTELEARGETAHHDQRTGEGSLAPAGGKRVTFERTPPGEEPDRGEAGRVSWDGEKRMFLTGGAKVWGPRVELAADEATYERGTGRLQLEGGRPVLRKVEGEWTTALKADRVVALETPKRIEARGKVTGWLLFRDQKKLKELTR